MMQTFATTAPITAVIDIPAGRIQISAADRADTTVEVRPADPSKGRDMKLAGQITTEYGNGTLRITAPSASRLFGSSGAADVTVHLPAGSQVEAKAASARFTTTGKLGHVTFDSAQGPVTVDQAATACLTTVDGDITAGRLGGDSQIRTVRGNVQVREADHGTLVLRTETGSITVGAAAGVSASLDAGTTVGRIRNALKNADGSPGLNIQATTTVGDITASSL
jgi:Putative adhesin